MRLLVGMTEQIGQKLPKKTIFQQSRIVLKLRNFIKLIYKNDIEISLEEAVVFPNLESLLCGDTPNEDVANRNNRPISQTRRRRRR